MEIKVEIPLNAQVVCTDGECGRSAYVLIEWSDFIPGDIYPEPRDLDSWQQKHWLRIGDDQP
jgi:hypothetical protein